MKINNSTKLYLVVAKDVHDGHIDFSDQWVTGLNFAGNPKTLNKVRMTLVLLKRFLLKAHKYI